jgi:diguanylate cyclase
MNGQDLEDLTAVRTVARPGWYAVAALWAIAVTGQLWLVMHDMLDVGSESLDGLTTNLVQNNLFLVAALLCAARAWLIEAERAAWTVIAVGAFAWFPAETLYHLVISRLDPVPFPSITDAFWLSSYPCFYIGLVLLARGRLREAGSALWLDGVVGALATAAVGAAVILRVVLPALGGPLQVVATNLAYPLADLVLLGFVVAMTALWGWRPGRAWVTLGVGLLVLVGADSMYLLASAQGSYASGDPVDAVWAAALLIVAAAAWQPRDVRVAVDLAGRTALALPTIFVLVALGVLAYDHFVRINHVAVGLAIATLLAAAGRTALAFRELRNFAETRRQATTDDLTGLANRRAFISALTAAVISDDEAETRRAVLVIDLDRFKEINDTFGHPVGDDLLVQVGARLEACLPAGGLLARLGGDEFAVLLPTGSDIDTAEATAQDLMSAITSAFHVDGVNMRLAASIGSAAAPEHGQDPTILLRCADIAMHQAKQNHGGHIAYAPERDTHDPDRIVLASELHGAIHSGEVVVFYQPQVDLASGRVCGVEALARWPHSRRGLLTPDVFIPVAERTGLMRSLTENVLAQAVAQASIWRSEGADLSVAVNLSATNLVDADLPGIVAAHLDRHGLPPGALTLEITEDQLMSDRDRAQQILEQLRALGVHIAIDDFGTGYSSLSQLRTLPVDELKIDKSFVMKIHEQPEDAAVVRLTIDLAHNLHLRVVAEGVETPQGLQMLRDLGAETAQGFLISRPVPAANLTAWLHEHAAGWTPAASVVAST